jgi:cellulose synthase (UDP-forming)
MQHFLKPPASTPRPSRQKPATAAAVKGQALEGPRKIVAVLFLLLGAWYLAWRPGTINPDAPIFSMLVYAAELFGFLNAALHIFMCWRLSNRQAPPPRVWPTVDVFIPTYNESPDLVRKTLIAAMAMEGAHTTWLLDDGRRPQMEALARALGCNYLTRPDNTHAKAGNLNHALRHSDGQLIAIFDCDHAPRRDFLIKTLGYFDNPRVAFVQTPQDFYNLDSYQHRKRGGQTTVWTEQSLFFRVIQRGKDCWNAAFFCGSCAVVRRDALDQIGGFATDTITEDLHTSLRLHARGWESVYHAQALAFGLAPESIEPFIAQRLRWGQGAMHVWRKEGILTHKGLTLAQRINYLASVLTYFDGWQKALFYIAPAIALITGVMPLISNTPDFVLHFVPYYVLTFWVFEEVGRGYGRSLFIEQYNMARFAAFAWATMAWIFPRMKFKVTPKGAPAKRAVRLSLPQWLVLGFNFGAIPVGIALYVAASTLPLSGLITNILWATVNGSLAIAVLSFTAAKQRFTRSRYRFPVPVAATLTFTDGSRATGTVDDLSDTGLRFYGPLPAHIQVSQTLSGVLDLPDGPLPFHGDVRSLIGTQNGKSPPRAIGCSLITSVEAQTRLEGFLFGSDLQWLVNGLTDQIHTPLSRLLPRWVAGPPAQPLAGRQWNCAQLRAEGGAKPQTALISTADCSERLVLSYAPLVENRTLALDVYARTESAQEGVSLERLNIVEAASLYIYQASTAPLPGAPAVAEAPAGQGKPMVAAHAAH